MSDSQLLSFEPATGALLWSGTVGNVDEAVAKARAAWPQWAGLPVANRIERIRRFSNEVLRAQDDLANLIARETGKALWEAKAEVQSVIDRVEIAVRAYADRTGQRRLNSALQGTTALRHKSHGVMAVISPYNMPAHIPNEHILPALVAGNAVVLKPSEKTPAVAEFLAGCFHRAGVPDDVLCVVQGGPDKGEELVNHPQVDGIFFTGSVQTGLSINRSLSDNPNKLLSLEMGGNNPIVLWDTPLLTDAATLLIQSAFSSAGQRCAAARRLIVKSSLYEPLVEQLKTLLNRIIIGGPFDDPAPFMGPLINMAAADRLTEGFLHLLANGGRPVLHMRRPIADLPFVTPGIVDVTDMTERPDVELFGPLLQIIRVDDFDHALAEANNTRFGLSASLIGGTPELYNRFWANIRAGIVNWNKSTIGPVLTAPIGGVGFSGNHRPNAFYAADNCAYPVTSAEMEQPRAHLGIGFKHD